MCVHVCVCVGPQVLLHAYTGSGKTLAFLLPIVQSLVAAAPPPGAPPRAAPPACLVLAPSRDLAMQIFRVADALLDGTGLCASQAIGGANPERQVEALRKRKPAVVVGTPGRVAELGLKQSKLNLGSVTYLVVDEADQASPRRAPAAPCRTGPPRLSSRARGAGWWWWWVAQ